MSHQATTAVFKSRGQQTASDRLVLLALADHAGPDGSNCRPGLPRVADMSDQSRSTTIRSIERLEGKCLTADHDDGCGCVHTRWIWVHRRPGRASHYVLLLAGLHKPDADGWQCPDCYRKAVSEWHRLNVDAPDDPPAAPVDSPVDNDRDQSQGDTTPPVSDRHPTSVTGDTPTRVTRDTTPVSPVTPDPSRTTSSTSSDPLPAGAGERGRSAHQQLLDAIADACHLQRPLTADAAAVAGKAASQLAQVGATVTDVDLRAARLRQRWGRDAVTPTSLAKHWPSLGDGPGGPAVPDDPAVEARQLAGNYAAMPWDHVEEALRGRGFDDATVAVGRDAWQQARSDGAAA